MTRRARSFPLRGRALKVALNTWNTFHANAVGIEPQLVEVKPARKKCALTGAPRASEHDLQKAVIDWWWAAHKTYGLPVFALYSVPNGAHLAGSFIAAAKLKSEGMRSGIPDLFLAVRRGAFGGFYAEMKAGHNKPSEEQIAVLSYLDSAGYRCSVHWSAESCIEHIKNYLGLPA